MSEPDRSGGVRASWSRSPGFLPRGGLLDDGAWRQRHRVVAGVLAAHLPVLLVVGLTEAWSVAGVLSAVLLLGLVTLGATTLEDRRAASALITLGLVGASATLVVLVHGAPLAYVHTVLVVVLLGLYQDRLPLLGSVALATLGLGAGALLAGDPWAEAGAVEAAVLAAGAIVVLSWRAAEDVQLRHATLSDRLARMELDRQQFASELLVSLARRNQGMFHRQLEIINTLEEKERDPDRLADLFRLDHLATRVRRNAESLLVLAGERSPRVWSAPVGLLDVVRAAVAETEDIERVAFAVDEHLRVIGTAVSDVTHLLAELVENAVRYSPPTSAVTARSRPHHLEPGAQLVLVEDTGVGIPPKELVSANAVLAQPRDVDASASRRLGFHVVSRLAARHGITVSLTPTPGSGLTAVVVLPAALFAEPLEPSPAIDPHPATTGALSVPTAVWDAEARAAGPDAAGRHAWPRASDGEMAEDRWAGPDGDPREQRTGAHAHHGQPPRGRLLQPATVPPPRAPDDGSAAAPARGPLPTPTPRAPSEPVAPVVPGGRRLSRRVPQSHLTPELNRAAPGERRPAPRPAPPAAGGVGALSAYQTSRRSAQREIGGGDQQEDDPNPGAWS